MLNHITYIWLYYWSFVLVLFNSTYLAMSSILDHVLYLVNPTHVMIYVTQYDGIFHVKYKQIVCTFLCVDF
jgi:hypothetical protein